MRIAMIGCKGIPASLARGGGVERHVEILSTKLVRMGHDVTVYVRPYANPRGNTSFKGCHLVTLPSIRTKYLDAWTHTFVSLCHAITQKYDVIHIHGVGPSTLAWIPRVFAPRASVVVTFHSQDQFHEKWNVFGRLYLAWGEWTALHFPNATIAVSHVIQQYCKKAFHITPYFIPNGVDLGEMRYGTARIRKMGLEPDKYFLGLGRLIPHKAYDIALEAFYGLQTDMRLVIAGDAGYDTKTSERLFALAERDPRVLMAGFRSGEDLEQLIAHCRALIHPSRSEGLSVSVLEAMAMGKPVIISDIPENLEVVGGCGMVFQTDSIDGLRRLMQRAIGHPEDLSVHGECGRDRVRELYAWESVARKVELVYEVLREGRKASTLASKQRILNT
ncbi:MAG: glycosyltransferase family 4 protein [Patescibacteria group bacterium]